MNLTQLTTYGEHDMTTGLTQIEKQYAIEAAKNADFGENWLVTANRALAIQHATCRAIWDPLEQPLISAEEARKRGAKTRYFEVKVTGCENCTERYYDPHYSIYGCGNDGAIGKEFNTFKQNRNKLTDSCPMAAQHKERETK